MAKEKRIKTKLGKSKSKNENGKEEVYDLLEPSEPIDFSKVESLMVNENEYIVQYKEEVANPEIVIPKDNEKDKQH